MSDKINLYMQIEEARRELNCRLVEYGPLVSRGKMRQAEADHQIDRMAAILATLEWFQEHETTVVKAVKAEVQS